MSTVLFVHGLESGPRGRKALALEQAGFTVVSGQMPCNRRAVVRDPVVIALAVTALATVVAASSRGALGFLICVIAFALLQRFVRPLLMRRMFRRSVDVQRALLAARRVDVVVGSSFGGAVALELLRSGAWKGPTVLGLIVILARATPNAPTKGSSLACDRHVPRWVTYIRA